MNLEMALKSRSYILDFLFSELFNGEFFSPAFRIYLYYCQKHTPKICKFIVLPNLTCGTGSLECNITSLSFRVQRHIFSPCEQKLFMTKFFLPHCAVQHAVLGKLAHSPWSGPFPETMFVWRYVLNIFIHLDPIFSYATSSHFLQIQGKPKED